MDDHETQCGLPVQVAWQAVGCSTGSRPPLPVCCPSQRASHAVPFAGWPCAPLQLGLVALYDLWKKTTGTLSLDLKRRQFKGGAPGDSLWRLQPAAVGGGGAGTRGRRRQGSRWSQCMPPCFAD